MPSSAPWRSSPWSSARRKRCSGSVARAKSASSSRRRAACEPGPASPPMRRERGVDLERARASAAGAGGGQIAERGPADADRPVRQRAREVGDRDRDLVWPELRRGSAASARDLRRARRRLRDGCRGAGDLVEEHRRRFSRRRRRLRGGVSRSCRARQHERRSTSTPTTRSPTKTSDEIKPRWNSGTSARQRDEETGDGAVRPERAVGNGRDERRGRARRAASGRPARHPRARGAPRTIAIQARSARPCVRMLQASDPAGSVASVVSSSTR